MPPTDPADGDKLEPRNSFTETSWKASAERKVRQRRVVLPLLYIFVAGVFFEVIRSRLPTLRTIFEDGGWPGFLSRVWDSISPGMHWALGFEAVFALTLIGGLLALSWWENEPKAPELPTVLTWFICVISICVIILGEFLSVVPPATAIAPLMILFSVLSIIAFLLWLFQPWFEYWRHLYCRWVFESDKLCALWASSSMKECIETSNQDLWECQRYWIHEFAKCENEETVREAVCTSWEVVYTTNCSTWPVGTQWLCTICSSVATWCCRAWSVVISGICRTWVVVRLQICEAWVKFVLVVCVLWYLFVYIFCAVMYFLMKLILVCWFT